MQGAASDSPTAQRLDVPNSKTNSVSSSAEAAANNRRFHEATHPSQSQSERTALLSSPTSEHVMSLDDCCKRCHAKPFSRLKCCSVCKSSTCTDANALGFCGSCEKLVHVDCTAPLPGSLQYYCLFCPDCQREPWHQGAIILAAGSSGASGMSKEKLSKKVDEIRAVHVRKRMLCPSGYQTYDGLRGDIVSFSDLFSQMVRTHDKDNIGFQLELVPGTAQTRRSGQYRLALEWAAPVTKAAQDTAASQVHVEMEQPRSTTPGQQASNRRASISGNQQSNNSAVTARQSSSFTMSTPASHPSPVQPPEISGEPYGTVQVKLEPAKSQGCMQLDGVGNNSNSSGPRKRRAEHVAAHHVKRHAMISKAGDDVIDLTGELDDPVASPLQNSTLRSADDAIHLLANAETEQSLLAQHVDNPPLENTISQSTGLSDQGGEPPVDSSEAPGIAGDATAPASAEDDLHLNPNNTAADGLAAPTSTTDSSVDWQAKQRLITEQLHRVHYHPDRLLAKYYAQCMKFGDREDDLHAFIRRLCECLEILVAAMPQQTQAEQEECVAIFFQTCLKLQLAA